MQGIVCLVCLSTTVCIWVMVLGWGVGLGHGSRGVSDSGGVMVLGCVRVGAEGRGRGQGSGGVSVSGGDSQQLRWDRHGLSHQEDQIGRAHV